MVKIYTVKNIGNSELRKMRLLLQHYGKPAADSDTHITIFNNLLAIYQDLEEGKMRQCISSQDNWDAKEFGRSQSNSIESRMPDSHTINMHARQRLQEELALVSDDPNSANPLFDLNRQQER